MLCQMGISILFGTWCRRGSRKGKERKEKADEAVSVGGGRGSVCRRVADVVAQDGNGGRITGAEVAVCGRAIPANGFYKANNAPFLEQPFFIFKKAY